MTINERSSVTIHPSSWRYRFPPPTVVPARPRPRGPAGHRALSAWGETRNCTRRNRPQRSARARSSARPARCGHEPRRSPTAWAHHYPAWGSTPCARAAALPSPRVVLSRGSTGTTTASDSLPTRHPLPGSSPVIGDARPRTPRSASAGEGLPSSRRHLLNVPLPLRRTVPRGCISRVFAASMAFAVIPAARHCLIP